MVVTAIAAIAMFRDEGRGQTLDVIVRHDLVEEVS
jgi:hypothetical protein